MPSKFLEGLLYALTAFGPLAFGCVEPWSCAVLEVLVLLLALGCFLRGGGEAPKSGGRFWLFPAAFAAFGLLQRLNPAAPDFPRPWGPFSSAPHETEAAVLLWTTYAALLWSVPRILSGHEAARRYVRFLFGLGLFVAFLGLAQAATGGGKLYWLRLVSPDASPFGPYYNRDHAANLLLMSMCAGVGLFFSRAKRARQADGPLPARVRSQALVAAGVVLLFAVTAFCRSRGAILAMPLAGAAMVLLGAGFAPSAGERRGRAAAALGALALVVFFAFRHVSAGVDAGALVEKSVMGRLYIYADGARWLRDAPVFGTGLGSFGTVYPSYQDQDLRAVVEHAHGDWLELALETGLFGLAAALAALLAAGWSATRAWHRARSSEMRALIAGALAAAVVFSAHSLTEFGFQIPGNAVVFLGVVGFLLSAPAWADKAAPSAAPRPPSADSAVLAVACFLLLALSAVRPAAASRLAYRAGDPAARAEAFAAGLSKDDDPRFLSGLAGAFYSLGASRGDSALLRASLGYALAAAERRPFDAGVLRTAGSGLRRLGRAEDAFDFFERTRRVSFSRIQPVKQ
ncbi:MAG: O-antigen ligase family protein [Elusimicrobia bacterium]|nr:O-antigen ligase family protein [Elusimicrobiota bacterium]